MKTTKNNITDWLEANPHPEIEALVNKEIDNFEKRKRDLKNKYKSQLAELENPKMDKRDKTKEIERLKLILKVIEEL